MSYLDQPRRKSPASIAAVIGVHLVVGYALLSGFAITVIKNISTIPTVIDVNDPPPPKEIPKELPRAKQPTPTNPTQTKPLDDLLKSEDPVIKTPTFDEIPNTGNGGGGELKVQPVEPARPSQAVGAVPAKDRLRWITTEDYPTAALRQEAQGLVVISVTIGTDGRVRSCLVTESSGNRLLDDTTCRLYSQRARFTPARDADGYPITAQRIDRYRWQIPTE